MSVGVYSQNSYNVGTYGVDNGVILSQLSYGNGAYNQGSYGQDVKPAEADATAVITCSPERILAISIQFNASSSSNSSAGYVKLGSSSITTISTCSAIGKRILNVESAASASSSTSSSSFRIRESGAISMGDSSVAIVYTRERESSLIIYGVVSISASAEVIKLGDAVSSATTTTITSFERVREKQAQVSSVSVVSSSANITAGSGVVIINTISSVLVTGSREQTGDGTITSTSSISAIGRKKWENEISTSVTWNTIAEKSTNWTDIAA